MIIIKGKLLFVVMFLIHMLPLLVIIFYVYFNNELYADHIKDSEEMNKQN